MYEDISVHGTHGYTALTSIRGPIVIFVKKEERKLAAEIDLGANCWKLTKPVRGIGRKETQREKKGWRKRTKKIMNWNRYLLEECTHIYLHVLAYCVYHVPEYL